MKILHRTRIVITAALILLIAGLLLSACSRSEGNPAVDFPKNTESADGHHQPQNAQQEPGAPGSPQAPGVPQETGAPQEHEAPPEPGLLGTGAASAAGGSSGIAEPAETGFPGTAAAPLNPSQPQAEQSAAPAPALHEAPAGNGAAAQNADAAAQSSQTEDPQKAAVEISIIGDKETGTILPPTQVKYEEGKSVFDILLAVLKDKGIQFEFRGRGPTVYIQGIDNLYEFDRGPKSGWMFRVNGFFSTKSAGTYTLHQGDRIEWLYTLDLGKDLRGKTE